MARLVEEAGDKSINVLKGYHVHIKGRVQGIGFRPFIYNLAQNHGLVGTVSNTIDGVHVVINCELCSMSKFIHQIKEQAPAQSMITDLVVEEVEAGEFSEFRIIESSADGEPDLLITPDFAMCDRCREELGDTNNRRYRYPFTTCTECGPRFSIERALPYDRQRTSMATFKMCPECQEEYEDPGDKRFYSQTNSCPKCRVSQWLIDRKGKTTDLKQDKVIDEVCKKIRRGYIVAVKGIGGFLLICDAQNHKKVMELRDKKQRPDKPFALLYPNLETVISSFDPSETEMNELKGAASPIVLLNAGDKKETVRLLPDIAPGLDRLGVMIPYAPVLQLIAEKVKKPLLATSGNIKGSPIIFTNEEAVKSLGNFADYILLNNRDIVVPQDDSVVKFSGKHKQKIIIRRSRGYAPGFMQEAISDFDKSVLSMGALLKSTFSIWNKNRCHVSQFLGDTMELDAQISYECTLNHFRDMLQLKPDVVLVDKHPAYFATQKGRELAAFYNVPLVEIQHHKAHFWAVLGENNLVHTEDQILGVIFDGTGMGSDGGVWGGEFFAYENHTIKRLHHINCFPHILGDKMAREPKLSALSLLHATQMNYNLEKDKFTREELDFYDRVLEHSSLCTSSVGRIFDAVASLLDYCHINTYEGEAAMYLECAAQEFMKKEGVFHEHYGFGINTDGTIDLVKMTSGIIEDVLNETDRNKIAAKFHNTLVFIIKDIAINSGLKSIAFSGGVFQNGLLVDLIIDHLGGEFTLYFHQQLSPNDECISYGQLVGYYAKQYLKKDKHIKSKTKNPA